MRRMDRGTDCAAVAGFLHWPTTAGGARMEHLLAVRQRVLQELTAIEAIKAVLAGRPNMAV